MPSSLPRKYPFDRLALFLLLARNSYKAIQAYLEIMEMGTFKGQELGSYECFIRNNANIKEKGFLSLSAPNPKRKAMNSLKVQAVTETSVEIVIKIPSKMKALAKRCGVHSCPYDNDNVRIMLGSQIIRRAVEVYLTSRMALKEITALVNEKFRMDFSEKDIEEYRYWAYDVSKMTPDVLLRYFDKLGHEERDLKNMAYMNKDDYVKWKMQDDSELNVEEATRKLVAQSFFSMEEIFKSKERVSHNAAKIWSEMFFKASEHLQRLKDGGSVTKIDILQEVRFVKNNSNSEDKIISFSELEGLDEDDGEE